MGLLLKLLICFLIIFLNSSSKLLAKDFDDIEISLITIGKGDELYSMFGHSALRIKDLSSNPKNDLVYNFGVFDSSQPDFIYNFLSGDLNYFSTIEQYYPFIQSYLNEKRRITELKLNLSRDKKEKIIYLLNENFKPENLYYKYKPFSENCATKIRDLIFHDEKIIFPTNEKTYRQTVHTITANKPWVQIGINILMGINMDKPLNSTSAMFLPENLELATKNTLIEIETDYLTQNQSRSDKKIFSFFYNPNFIFFLLLGISVYLSLSYSKNSIQILFVFDFILFFIVGIIGGILGILSVWSKHDIFNTNLNILWALPTHLIYAWFVNSPNRLANIYRLGSLILILISIFVLLFQQKSEMVTMILIFLLLAFRLINHIKSSLNSSHNIISSSPQ